MVPLFFGQSHATVLVAIHGSGPGVRAEDLVATLLVVEWADPDGVAVTSVRSGLSRNQAARSFLNSSATRRVRSLSVQYWVCETGVHPMNGFPTSMAMSSVTILAYAAFNGLRG